MQNNIEDVFFFGVATGFEAIPAKYRQIAHQKHYNTKFSGTGVKLECVDAKIWLSYVNYDFLNVDGRPNASFGFTFVIREVPTQFESIGALFDVLFQSLIKQLDFAFPVDGGKRGYQFRPEFSQKFNIEYSKLVVKLIEAFEKNVPSNRELISLQFENNKDLELFNIADKNLDLILERFAVNGRVYFNKTAPSRKESAMRIRTANSDEILKLQEQIRALSEEKNLLQRESSTNRKLIEPSVVGDRSVSFSTESRVHPILKLFLVSGLSFVVAGYLFYQQSRIIEKLDNLEIAIQKKSQTTSNSQLLPTQESINSPIEKKTAVTPEWLTLKKNRFYLSSSFIKVLSQEKPNSSEFNQILVDKFASNFEFFTTCLGYLDAEEFLKGVYELNPVELGGKLTRSESLKWHKYKVTGSTVIANFPLTSECKW